MDDFVKRQLTQMRFQVADFRSGKISLNTFLTQIETLARMVDEKLWAEAIYPIAFELEQINADLVEERRKPTPEESKMLEELLLKLESLIAEKANQ